MSGDKISRFRRARARQLRANETSAEALLWRAMDRIPLIGTHFRRQAPIGPYVVDFACLRAKLIVELDGPSHTRDGAAARDDQRTAWLEKEGYRVIRLWNSDVFQNLDGALDAIYAALYGGLDAEAKPFPRKGSPSPGGGGSRQRRGVG